MKKINRPIAWSVLVLTTGVAAVGIFQWMKDRWGSNPPKQERVAAYFWERHPSIYEHIQRHTIPEGLASDGVDLPDEKKPAKESGIRFAPGVMDNICGSQTNETDVATVKQAIQAYCREPTSDNKQKVFDCLAEKHVPGFIDPLLDALAKDKSIHHERLFALAKSLAVESPERHQVKVGIAILGLFRDPECRPIFQTLGMHEEFTVYSVTAIANASSTAEKDIWELSKKLHGWGRINSVDRLANTRDPQIKEWLLREGYKNEIMYEYSACTCAKSGGLRRAMSQPEVDEGLLAAAGDLLEALIPGGAPTDDMREYEDGVAVTELYLDQLVLRASTLHQFLVVGKIKDWLENQDVKWDSEEWKAWSGEKRSRLLNLCRQITDRSLWKKLAVEGLGSEDDIVFYQAECVARTLGIDPWDSCWERLQKMPLKSGRWFHAMRACNFERIDKMVVFARETLPMDKLSAGAANEMGLGKEYEIHGCLDAILQDLGKYPGHGFPLIKVGLCSPVIRNRNMALNALEQWGKGHWPPEASGILEAAIVREPNQDVLKRMKKLLDAKTP